MGRLFLSKDLRNPRFLSALRTSSFVITVGDRVTETMQDLGRTPDLQIVDQVERRVKRVAPEAAFVTILRASNPPGTITDDSVAAIERAISAKGPARVLIEGEEDLLVLPAILAAPAGAILYYGQPGEGVVAVKVDERAKTSARRILMRMKRG